MNELNLVQKDIVTLKTSVEDMKQDIRQLQDKTLIHDRDIREIQMDLKDIKEDTKWLRRAITNAFIVGLIGGAVAIFYAAMNFNL
ncbi:hemolysin XhlA family protein [Cytobacillus sp.]|uniref:hemolysin XhlA family protein n=1 Tax=Cytobacillus sp. TaxID=2675269 RepID=UPI0028BD391E|nr:hemolysin XhlA family protein [Cytobacillus sp.]